MLARHDAADPRAIASITKLMTALVVLEHAQLDDVVRVSPQAAGIGESTVYLRAGEELTVAELLRATLIPSANDAAEALALHVGRGSADRFVGLMNAKAATAWPLGHALRESARARRAGPRLERAGCDRARPLCARHPVHPGCALALERLASRRKDVRIDRRSPRLLAAARRWKDGPYARRGLVANGGRSARRDDGLRRGSRKRHAELAERRAGGAAHLRARPVPRRAADRPNARLRDRRDRATASPTSSSSRRARSSRSIRVGRPLVERVVAPTVLALPVAKGQQLGRVEIFEGDRLVASSALVAAAAVPDAGVWAKAKWHATQTVRNLWEMLT